MSTSSDNLETALRVTRSRLRLNSTDSLNIDLEQRPETPTGKSRNAKKLEIIEERANTPTRRNTRSGSIQRENETIIATPNKRNTRAGSVQRITVDENITAAVITPTKRLTRAGSIQRIDEIKSSPLRRTTRRMSNEMEKNTSIQDSSIIIIDDESISENALTPKTFKRNRRISAVTKLEEVVEEDPVIITINEELNKSDSSNELELRNRSISKSPNIAQRASLNSNTNELIVGANVQDVEKNVEHIPDIVNDDNQTGSPTKAMNKFLTSRISFNANDNVSSDEMIENQGSSKASPSKSLQRRSRVTEENENSSKTKSPLKIATEQKKIECIEKLIIEEKQKCENTKDVNDDLVSQMMGDFIPEIAASSKQHESFDASKIQNKNVDLFDLRLRKQSSSQSFDTISMSSQLGRLLNENESDMDIDLPSSNLVNQTSSESSNTNASKSSKKRRSLNKTKFENEKDEDLPESNLTAQAVDEESNINIAKSPKQRRSLKKSKAENENDEDLSESNLTAQALDEESNNITAKSPKQRRSLNKSKAENEKDEHLPESNFTIQALDEESKINTSKSPKQRRSLNEKQSDVKKDEDLPESNFTTQAMDEDSNIYISKSPKQRRSLNEKQSDMPTSKNNSWSQSVRNLATQCIDHLKIAETKVIKDSRDRSKIISSDESEDEQNSDKNSFINDEADVGSEGESITLSELNYMKENEINIHGETLGSEDSEIDDELGEEEEEEDDDSFIDDNEHISDEYSMDSEEEFIEKEDKKRKSRIIMPSSSSEDESKEMSPVKAKSPAKINTVKENECNNDDTKNQEEVSLNNSIKRKSVSINENVELIEEKSSSTVNAEVKSKKRKRASDFEKAVVTPKRIKVMSANESEAVHMEDNSHLVNDENSSESEQEMIIQKENKKPISKKQKREVDLSQIFQRVNEYMDEVKSKKKVQSALRMEKKAKKLAKKKELNTEEPNNIVNSLSGDDKENSLKKKKKKKNVNKKLKLAGDVDNNKKDNLSSRLDKMEEKLKLKQQRKREKKLAKMQNIASTEKPITSEVEKPKKNEKSEKVKEIGDSKSKKSAKHIDVVQITQKPSADHDDSEKKKSKKKRKIEETDEDLTTVINVPQVNKKLKVLKQIDEPFQHVRQKQSRFEEPKKVDSAISLNKKLKNIIPGNSNGIPSKELKKSKKERKVVAEPKISLPRPVFTTAGVFLEEPITPVKFKKEYKPIKSEMGRERVALFQASKKKQKAAQFVDFKTEKLLKKNARDKSIKNLKNLI